MATEVMPTEVMPTEAGPITRRRHLAAHRAVRTALDAPELRCGHACGARCGSHRVRRPAASLATAAIQAGVALAELLGFAGLGNAANLPLEIAALVGCPFTYHGLVHWNRHRTLTADPGDWLNGISAGLALVALGNLIVQWSDVQLVDWQTWQLESWLVRISAVVVVVGTAPTVAALGGLLRDVRVWMVSFGFAIVVAEAASQLPVTAGFGSWLQGAWVLAVAIGWAAVMAPAGLQPRGSTSRAPTIGALVVLLASVSLLVLDDLPGNHA